MIDDPNMLDYAIGYARKGIYVFPIWDPYGDICTCEDTGCGSIGKHPIEYMVPRGCLDATLDEGKIRKWWADKATANIGVACGKSFFVVDIDPQHKGFESLAELEAEKGKLPETIRARSGGGGDHYFYKMPEAKVKGRIAMRPGIDIKSSGGYVVAPPSRHKSGRQYEFISGKVPMADAPSWLIDMINGPDCKPRFDVANALKGVAHGQRYYTLLSLAGKMRRADVPFDVALEMILKCAANCVPPAPELDSQKILEKAYKTWPPGEVIVPRVEVVKSAPDMHTLQDVTTQYLEKLKSSKGMKYITTGIDSVDYAIGGGIDCGEMVIVAARPSHGKSAFALHLLDASSKIGIPTAIVSEEMSGMMLGKRTVQYSTQVAEYRWLSEIDRVENEVDKHFADRSPCYVLEGCRTADRTVEAINNLVNNSGVRVVAVDYAQLLGGGNKSRYEQITQTSIALRQVASSCKISLIVVCQLNRNIAERDKFIPRLDDLKDSGQLEQDADVVMSLVWPWYLDNSNSKLAYQVWINKNRNRQICSPMVQCKFDPSRQMFFVNTNESDDSNVHYEPRWMNQ